MFTYQKDTKCLFVAECDKKVFWREIRKSSTAFNIDTRREILHAIDVNDETEMKRIAEHRLSEICAQDRAQSEVEV